MLNKLLSPDPQPNLEGIPSDVPQPALPVLSPEASKQMMKVAALLTHLYNDGKKVHTDIWNPPRKTVTRLDALAKKEVGRKLQTLAPGAPFEAFVRQISALPKRVVGSQVRLKDIVDVVGQCYPEANPDERNGIVFQVCSQVTGWLKLDADTLKELFASVDEGVKTLCIRADVKRLDFGSSGVSDEGLTAISQARNLHGLKFGTSVGVTANGIAHLRNMDHLEDVDLSVNTNINDECMAHLSTLPNLKVLRSSYGKMTDHGVEQLARSGTLVVLSLGSCPKITDAAVASLRGLPNLSSLSLSNNYQLTGSSLNELASLENLRELDLWQCFQMMPENLMALGQCRSLERLDLRQCSKVNNAVVAQLSQLPNLRYLDLANCRNVGPEGVAKLSNAPRLTELSLYKVKGSDESVAQLARSRSLRRADLRHCEGVTWQAIDNFPEGVNVLTHVTKPFMPHMQPNRSVRIMGPGPFGV
jgi:hypothetical protein